MPSFGSETKKIWYILYYGGVDVDLLQLKCYTSTFTIGDCMATKNISKFPNRRLSLTRPLPPSLQGRKSSTYNPVTCLPVGTPPPPMPKKPKVPTVVAEPNEFHRDIIGRPLQVGQFVLAVDNNRIMVCSIKHFTAKRVALVPALEHKRSFAAPKKKTYIKECFNVAIIPEEEWFMYKLFGEN